MDNAKVKFKNSIHNAKHGLAECVDGRRKFLIFIPLLTIASLFPKKGYCFFGMIFSAIARSAGRSVLRSAVRSGSRGITRSIGSRGASGLSRSTSSISRRYRNSINNSKYSSKSDKPKTYAPRKRSNVSAKSTIKNLSEVTEILPDLAELAIEAAAEAIWVKSNTENEAVINLENTTSSSSSLGEIYVVIRDIHTGEVESRTSLGLIQAKPNAKHSFEIIISDLPESGIKRLEVESQIDCQPSRNIVVV
jgi:hypothetical protein